MDYFHVRFAVFHPANRPAAILMGHRGSLNQARCVYKSACLRSFRFSAPAVSLAAEVIERVSSLKLKVVAVVVLAAAVLAPLLGRRSAITARLLSLATDRQRVCHGKCHYPSPGTNDNTDRLPCVVSDRQRCPRPQTSVEANAIQPTVTFGC